VQNGEFIDLCRGPHVPYSTMIQAFAATRNSATNWLGKTDNDTLQRVYGVSFPDKKELKKWQDFQEQVRCGNVIVS
jgi:threonyl-tRNA synthetase